MNVREFLFYENMTVGELAKKARISRGYLDRIINGNLMPSERACQDLQKATKGKVEIPEGLFGTISLRNRKKTKRK